MVNKVEMSLADIIKTTKVGKGGRGGARGQNRGRGGAARGQSRGGAGRGRGGAVRGVSKNRGGAPRGGAQRGITGGRRMARGGGGRGAGGGRGGGGGGGRGWNSGRGSFFSGGQARPAQIQTGPAKLQITNLDFGVTDTDVVELFSEFGKMKGASVHYDRSGRSLGTAHVAFDRRPDAVKAIRQYNGVHLDGRPMHITFDGQAASPANKPQITGGSFRGGVQQRRGAFRGGVQQTRGTFRGGRGNVGRGAGRGGRGAGRGGRGAGVKRLQGTPKSIRGGNRGGRGRGRGGRGAKKTPPTVEELDKELDAYVTEASK